MTVTTSSKSKATHELRYSRFMPSGGRHSGSWTSELSRGCFQKRVSMAMCNFAHQPNICMNENVSNLSRVEGRVSVGTPIKDLVEKRARGRPSGYTTEACNQVITLMSSGLSLTASAGVMGVGRTTVHRWMGTHEDFRDAVLRGQAARTFKLETMLLETQSAAVVRLCGLALINAAPEEWRKKRSTV